MARRPSQAWAIVTFLFLSWSNPAHAFWSRLGLNDHGVIIQSALNKNVFTYSIEGSELKISEFTLKRLSDRVIDSDRKPLDGIARFHFDNETLIQGYKDTQSRVSAIIRLLSVENPWDNQEASWRILGITLHGVQDFYSHSTWVEQGNNDIVNFSSPTPNQVFTESPSEIGPVCFRRKPEHVIPGGKITTGYYHRPMPGNGLEKCHHGSVGTAIARCLVLVAGEIPPPKDGINKDSITCSPINRRAANLAIEETSSFVRHILNTLHEKKNIDGICALMGITKEDCPKEEPETDDTSTGQFKITKLEYEPSLTYSKKSVGGVGTHLKIYWEASQKFWDDLKQNTGETRLIVTGCPVICDAEKCEVTLFGICAFISENYDNPHVIPKAGLVCGGGGGVSRKTGTSTYIGDIIASDSETEYDRAEINFTCHRL